MTAIGAMVNQGLNLTRIYTSGVNVTETIPNNPWQVLMECWGGGGSGGGSSSPAATGGGGGSGGLSVSNYPITNAQWGQTIKYTIGTGGAASGSNANGNDGSESQIFSGTFTVTTMTAFQGIHGLSQPNGANGGAGAGVSTGGNVSNLGGNAGTNGGFCVIGTPGASVPGQIFTDNQASALYGAGSFGHSNNAGTAANNGAAVFYYQ